MIVPFYIREYKVRVKPLRLGLGVGLGRLGLGRLGLGRLGLGLRLGEGVGLGNCR